MMKKKCSQGFQIDVYGSWCIFPRTTSSSSSVLQLETRICTEERTRTQCSRSSHGAPGRKHWTGSPDRIRYFRSTRAELWFVRLFIRHSLASWSFPMSARLSCPCKLCAAQNGMMYRSRSECGPLSTQTLRFLHRSKRTCLASSDWSGGSHHFYPSCRSPERAYIEPAARASTTSK
jgi:hypothetical protein